MNSRVQLAAALSLTLFLASASARAQVVGDTVRLTTAKGTVEGVLVERAPSGYVVAQGKTRTLVPYATVTQIIRVAPAAKNAKGAPAAEEFRGLAVDPAPVPPAPAGTEPPPPPPPPARPAVAAPPPPVVAPPPPLSPVMVPVPALPARPKPLPPVQYERRSKLVMGTGIVFVGLGVIAAITGLGLVIEGTSQADQLCEYYKSGQRCYTNPNKQTHIDAGRVTMLAGTAVGVLGIPIWSIGAKKVPVKEPSAQLTAGPGRAALTLRF